MEYHVYWLLKGSCLEIFGDWKYGLSLSQKVDGKIFTEYPKSSCFELFRDGIYGLFWAKKLMERWYLLIAGKFLFWTFRRWEIRSFFERRNWWKDDIYWLLKSFCFELLGDGKYSIFFSEKVDGKIIFTWTFWTFHDIPGLGKYGFLCSARNTICYEWRGRVSPQCDSITVGRWWQIFQQMKKIILKIMSLFQPKWHES